MATWNDDDFFNAAEEYAAKFPDSDWGMEGCGLTADEAIGLMERSVMSGIDHLTQSYPEYPEGAVIA